MENVPVEILAVFDFILLATLRDEVVFGHA